MSQLYPPEFSSSWPLIGSQLGIWFADQLSHQRHELNVAHYVEIQGNIDVPLLSTAIEIGLSEADTLHSHYVEQDGQIVQIFIPPSTCRACRTD
ncbi:condensation domain-containing protein [Vibrio sp. PP-XX7]